MHRTTERAEGIPWELDAPSLLPKGQSGPQGLAQVRHWPGWSMLGFCDRSVDTRGGSHSAFVFEKDYMAFRELVVESMTTFPEVWSRFTFQIKEYVP